MSDRLTQAQQQKHELAQLRAELTATKNTLGTLIAWMVQSANSPIRRDEAEILLKAIHTND